MFSVPLGIMFGADVSPAILIYAFRNLTVTPSLLLLSTSESKAYSSMKGGCNTYSVSYLAFLFRSLIASFLGNVVGALFVALPATYMYLGDYKAGGLRPAEDGEIVSSDDTAQSSLRIDNGDKKQG